MAAKLTGHVWSFAELFDTELPDPREVLLQFSGMKSMLDPVVGSRIAPPGS